MAMTIVIPPVYAEKLEALAKARGKSPEACILDFIDACQPGGGGWKHPSEAKPVEGNGASAQRPRP